MDLKKKGKDLFPVPHIFVYFGNDSSERFFILPAEEVPKLLIEGTEKYWEKKNYSPKDDEIQKVVNQNLPLGRLEDEGYEDRWDILKKLLA